MRVNLSGTDPTIARSRAKRRLGAGSWTCWRRILPGVFGPPDLAKLSDLRANIAPIPKWRNNQVSPTNTAYPRPNTRNLGSSFVRQTEPVDKLWDRGEGGQVSALGQAQVWSRFHQSKQSKQVCRTAVRLALCSIRHMQGTCARGRSTTAASWKADETDKNNVSSLAGISERCYTLCVT